MKILRILWVSQIKTWQMHRFNTYIIKIVIIIVFKNINLATKERSNKNNSTVWPRLVQIQTVPHILALMELSGITVEMMELFQPFLSELFTV